MMCSKIILEKQPHNVPSKQWISTQDALRSEEEDDFSDENWGEGWAEGDW